MMAESLRDLAIECIRQLHEAGFQGWLVGGCVRDRLLGAEPEDYDIATDARPPQISVLFPDAVEVGASFGVMLLRRGAGELQIATFRSETGYGDGRHPDAVAFETSPAQDAARRDFTINALFENPLSGELLDLTGGLEDLKSGILRAVGEPAKRFAEDHLRMMRAVRFAARLGFAIETRTAAAIRSYAAGIQRISAERVRDELARILTEGSARRGMELLDELGLLAHILPEALAMKGVEQSPDYHPEGDVWTHTMIMLGLLNQPSLTLALGVLFHDIGKPETQTIEERIRFHGHVEAGVRIARSAMARLRFSHEQTELVLALVANHMRFMHLADMRESTRKRFLRMERFGEHLELHRVDCASSHGKLGNYELAKSAVESLAEEELRPTPLLTGHNLIAAGYTPGPLFKEILEAVEDQQLEGSLRTPAEALAWVRNQFPGQDA